YPQGGAEGPLREAALFRVGVGMRRDSRHEPCTPSGIANDLQSHGEASDSPLEGDRRPRLLGGQDAGGVLGRELRRGAQHVLSYPDVAGAAPELAEELSELRRVV